jgi:hypothetical protein
MYKQPLEIILRRLKMIMALSLGDSVCASSKASTFFGRSNVGIAGLKPGQGMDVCLRLSVLCCPM